MAIDVGKGAKSLKSDPNVVPLCDVLLVLLIIFFVITPAIQKGIDVKLPEPGGSKSVMDTSSVIVLSLKSDGSVLINKEPVDSSLVSQRLREIYATRTDKTIFIRASTKIAYKEVVRIIDLAKGAGVEVIGIMPEVYTE
ncbi:MAG: ExbD/TolR family protein [Candidatus Aminicenantia bacterium]